MRPPRKGNKLVPNRFNYLLQKYDNSEYKENYDEKSYKIIYEILRRLNGKEKET